MNRSPILPCEESPHPRVRHQPMAACMFVVHRPKELLVLSQAAQQPRIYRHHLRFRSRIRVILYAHLAKHRCDSVWAAF